MKWWRGTCSEKFLPTHPPLTSAASNDKGGGRGGRGLFYGVASDLKNANGKHVRQQLQQLKSYFFLFKMQIWSAEQMNPKKMAATGRNRTYQTGFCPSVVLLYCCPIWVCLFQSAYSWLTLWLRDFVLLLLLLLLTILLFTHKRYGIVKMFFYQLKVVSNVNTGMPATVVRPIDVQENICVILFKRLGERTFSTLPHGTKATTPRDPNNRSHHYWVIKSPTIPTNY